MDLIKTYIASFSTIKNSKSNTSSSILKMSSDLTMNITEYLIKENLQ